MAYEIHPSSKLQELELAHADEGQLADYRRSNVLATESTDVDQGYFFSGGLVGSLLGISLALTGAYWAFSPPAAIITVINADIGPSDNSSLFSIVWSMSAGVSIILFGRISDKFGRRWFVISASTLAFIGGIIASRAQNMDTLIGANVFLGLGAGVQTCFGLTIGEICPNKYKFLGIALCVVPSCVGTGFGAYLAIAISRTYSWRYIYYIFLPIMGVAVILQFLFYRPPTFKQLHGNDRTRKQELKRVDWIGAFLLIAGLVLFLLGVSWGGEPLPWTSSKILGLLISGGIILFIIFPLWEIYSHTPNPLIPMHFFKDIRGFLMMIVIGSVSGTVYLASALIWPSQVAAIYASSVTNWQAKGWASTTVAFGIYGGLITLVPLVGVLKHVRIQLIVYMAVSISFLGALASCNSGNFGRSAAFSFLATFPVGALEMMSILLVQMDSNDADLGTVSAIIFLFRTAMGCVFATVFVAILRNKIPQELAAIVPPAVIKAGLPASSIPDLLEAITAGTSAALAKVPGINPHIEAALAPALSTAYAAAYAYVYYAAVAIGLVGLIACCFVKDYDPYFNNHVPRQIYNAGQEDLVHKESSTATDLKEFSTDKVIREEVEVRHDEELREGA